MRLTVTVRRQSEHRYSRRTGTSPHIIGRYSAMAAIGKLRFTHWSSPARKGGRLGDKAAAGRSASERYQSAKKAARMRKKRAA
jgi:hypothetical protein